MPKMTIIMPSYNVAGYIRDCMDSVVSQTLKDIEILAVDAGSDDGTLEILKMYADRDKRIILIHSDRKSYGYQLNLGISLACGEYVGVVETDDRIVPDMFQSLYERAVNTGADYVKGCALSTMKICPEIMVTNRILCTAAEGMERPVIPKQTPKLFVTDRFLWLGIYKTSFIKTVKLNETQGAAFQDISFMFQVLSRANKAVYLDKDIYYYRQDNESASSNDTKGFQYLVAEYTYAGQFLDGKNREWHQAFYEKMLSQCFGRFRVMAASGKFWTEAVSDMKTLKERIFKALESGLFKASDMDEDKRKLLTLFLKSEKDIYEYYVRELEEKRARTSSVLKTVSGHPAVIFGCGAAGRFFHALLEKRLSGAAVAYCDNNPELWGTKVQGMPVLTPEEAVCSYPEAIYVAASIKSADIIKKQLISMGIKDRQICIFREYTDLMLFRVLD